MSAQGDGARLVGVMGWPVGHSLSPSMHNAALRALGLDWRYLLLPVQPHEVPAAVRGLRALGFAGANVTIPHKVAVAALMDELTPEALAVGAVNTIIIRDGRFTGHNTDAYGFLTALTTTGYAPAARSALVLGAGGAARSVVFALASAGAIVSVYNRTEERAHALIAALAPHLSGAAVRVVTAHDLATALLSAELVVNATAVGMTGGPPGSPLPAGARLRAGATAYDLVYTPRRTPFLRQASAAGAHSVGGLGMLVHQGAQALELWSGRSAPVDVMARAARRALAARARAERSARRT